MIVKLKNIHKSLDDKNEHEIEKKKDQNSSIDFIFILKKEI